MPVADAEKDEVAPMAEDTAAAAPTDGAKVAAGNMVVVMAEVMVVGMAAPRAALTAMVGAAVGATVGAARRKGAVLRAAADRPPDAAPKAQARASKTCARA